MGCYILELKVFELQAAVVFVRLWWYHLLWYQISCTFSSLYFVVRFTGGSHFVFYPKHSPTTNVQMTHSSAARRWKYNHFIMSRLFEHRTKKKICIICIMCAMAVGPTAVTGTIDWHDEQCYVPATQSACGLYYTTHTTRQINSDCS